MPLLVAVWQSKITARYNIVEEGTAGVEGIGELKLVSHCCEFTLTLEGLFTLLLSPVIAENLIQNCQLNQFVAPSGPAFALYLQELQ